LQGFHFQSPTCHNSFLRPSSLHPLKHITGFGHGVE
jgi:hypothetical protein